MTNIGIVASIIATLSAQYMTKTQNLLQFSLKCQPIHPGIHKDLSIGAPAYDTLMAARIVAGIVS